MLLLILWQIKQSNQPTQEQLTYNSLLVGIEHVPVFV